MSPRHFVFALLLLILTSCSAFLPRSASSPSVSISPAITSSDDLPIKGRLSLRVESDPAQAYYFQFNGWLNKDKGHLECSIPGAWSFIEIKWDAQQAVLIDSEKKEHRYNSFQALSQAWIGNELPLPSLALLAQGKPISLTGWHIKTSATTPLKIQATRFSPQPAIDLTLVIEKEPS